MSTRLDGELLRGLRLALGRPGLAIDDLYTFGRVEPVDARQREELGQVVRHRVDRLVVFQGASRHGVRRSTGRCLVSPAGRVLTWDGRLDNRDGLLLQFHRDLGIDATDGALALAVFERWGVDGFARLIR